MAVRFYFFLLIFSCALANGAPPSGSDIVQSARKQINVTVVYDPQYVKLTYPMAMLRLIAACAQML